MQLAKYITYQHLYPQSYEDGNKIKELYFMSELNAKKLTTFWAEYDKYNCLKLVFLSLKLKI